MFLGKKSIVICFCCVYLLTVLFIGINSAAAAPVPVKKRIAVMDFKSEYHQTGQGITDMLVAELVKNKKFDVVERNRIQQVLREQGLSASGATETDAVKLGKLLNVDYLIFGSVAGVDAEIKNYIYFVQHVITATLTMRLVDTTTGQIIFAETAKGSEKSSVVITNDFSAGNLLTYGAGNKAALKALRPLVNKLNDLHPTEGAVVKVEDKKIYIDLGTEHGVAPDQIYMIFWEKPVYHPINNNIVGVEKIQVGTMKISAAYDGMSVGEINKGDKKNMKHGLLVRRVN